MDPVIVERISNEDFENILNADRCIVVYPDTWNPNIE